jgi:20S proteasome subunit beta 3
MLAMKGKNCVAIASDTRLGTNLSLVSQNFQRVFKINDRTLMGLCGLATDVDTL